MKIISLLFMTACLSTHSFAANLSLKNRHKTKHRLSLPKFTNSTSKEEEYSDQQYLTARDSGSEPGKTYDILIAMSTEELLALILPNRRPNEELSDDDAHEAQEWRKKNRQIIGSILAKRGAFDF